MELFYTDYNPTRKCHWFQEASMTVSFSQPFDGVEGQCCRYDDNTGKYVFYNDTNNAGKVKFMFGVDADIYVNAASLEPGSSVNGWGGIAGEVVARLNQGNPQQVADLQKDWNAHTQNLLGKAAVVKKDNKPAKLNFGTKKDGKPKESYLIHTAAPDARGPDKLNPNRPQPASEKHRFESLKNAYLNTLLQAASLPGQPLSIAIPSLGTGIFANEPELSAKAAAEAVAEFRKLNPDSKLQIKFSVPWNFQQLFKAHSEFLNQQAAAPKPAGVAQDQPPLVAAGQPVVPAPQVNSKAPISPPPPSPLQSKKLSSVSKDMPMPYLPMNSGPIVGIAPFKGNTPPFGAFANTTEIVNGKGVYQVVQDKTMDGKPIIIDGKPRTFNWPSSENAYHAQKLIAYKQELENKDPKDPKIAVLDKMLVELEGMPKSGDKFLPKGGPDTYEGLVNRNLAELGFSDKKAFDNACKADYHPKFNPSGGINPGTNLPYTYDYMKFAVQLKLEQHPELKEMAKECARRGIMPVEISQYDQTWASFDGSGRNLLGIAILELGNKYLKAEDKIDGPITNPHTAYASLQQQHKDELSHGNVSKYVSGNNPIVFPDSVKPVAAPPSENSAGEALFTVHPAVPVFTPQNNAAAVPPRTPIVVDPRAQLKEIANKITNFSNDQHNKCGIMKMDDSKINDPNNPTLTLGIICDNGNKTRNVYITPASAEGGVVYSIEKSINPLENQKLLDNAIRVAVEAATPGTVLSIPAGADKESEKALMKAMDDIYGEGKYMVDNGKVTVPAERPQKASSVIRADP